MSFRRLLFALAAILVLACGDEVPESSGVLSPPETTPPTEASTSERPTRTEIHTSLLEDIAQPRHPADGGGRAWLGQATPHPTAGRGGRFELFYEAGEAGIAVGGTLFLQVSPFWGWSTPQVTHPERPGYTTVETAAEGVRLEAKTLDQQLLGIRIAGRALAAGERIRLVYGAGNSQAQVDRYAEEESRFWFAVDGDGDGVRQVLTDSPKIAIHPGRAARLVLLLPSTAHPGDTVRATLAVLDGLANAGVPFDGEIQLRTAEGKVPDLPERLRLTPEDAGRRTFKLSVPQAGLVRLAATGPRGLEVESNPLQVSEKGLRILWGDLQNHSGRSDGTGTPEELFHYARDIAALDVYALTDHDHWGLLFLDQHPQIWREIRGLNQRFHEPGRFVTLLGFEWTHWVWGHRHVLYFDDDGPLFSSLDPATDTPQELWTALEDRRALTIAHHSAGGPISTDWSIPPDPVLETVTEIVSVHGSSEAADSPGLIHRPVPGNFVRDALDRGYRLGFLGSSDGHDGHPGLAHLTSATGGLAAILAEDLTREAVYEALRNRRVYATSGPRILLRASLGGHPMGSILRPEDVHPDAPSNLPGINADILLVQTIAPGPIARIEIIRSGQVTDRLDIGGDRRASFALPLGPVEPGEYVYLRVVQEDGATAWSSPFFIEDSSTNP